MCINQSIWMMPFLRFLYILINKMKLFILFFHSLFCWKYKTKQNTWVYIISCAWLLDYSWNADKSNNIFSIFLLFQGRNINSKTLLINGKSNSALFCKLSYTACSFDCKIACHHSCWQINVISNLFWKYINFVILLHSWHPEFGSRVAAFLSFCSSKWCIHFQK